MTINQMLLHLKGIEINLNENCDKNYCKATYEQLTEIKNGLGIECPFEIYEKIDQLIKLSHKIYTNLINYDYDVEYNNNIDLRNLGKNISHAYRVIENTKRHEILIDF